MVGFNIETLIGFYMCICIALIFYNIVYILYEWESGHLRSFQTRHLERMILEQQKYLELSGKLDDRHALEIHRMLKKVHSLVAFQKACEVLQEKYSIDPYLDAMIPIFQSLALVYQEHEDMEKAYFAWLIAQLYQGNEAANTRLGRQLLPYLTKTSIYCRENTLSALYRLGNIHTIEKAFHILNEQGNFHHEKLITDGLLKFCGDTHQLAATLWKHYEEWNTILMTAIIDYIRYVDASYGQKFLIILQDPKGYLEIRLSILRYYRKYQYWDAFDTICACASGEYGVQCAIVGTSALENYPNERSCAVLKSCMTSGNWYVRKNAAASLLAIGSTMDIQDILQGEDRYAKEMLTYMLSSSKEAI